MSKLYLFIMLFSFLGLNLSAQIQEPVRFTVEQKKTGTGELEIRFKAEIDEGWHVYGPENAEGGPTVATLTLENSKGVELPSTGGEGTMMLITIGTMVAMVFAVLLITHKKMSIYHD